MLLRGVVLWIKQEAFVEFGDLEVIYDFGRGVVVE